MKVLVVGDDARIHTGFARQIREIFLHFCEEIEVVQYGWFGQKASETVPWRVINTERGPTPSSISSRDKYGDITFDRVLHQVSPDLIWSMGDYWMVRSVSRAVEERGVPWIHYIPTDGEPIVADELGQILEDALVVPYTTRGKQIIESASPLECSDPIPHGIHTAHFSPSTFAERSKLKRDVFGLSPNDVLIGAVGRMNRRKQMPLLLELFDAYRKGMWGTCSTCGRPKMLPYDPVSREYILDHTCSTVQCSGNIELVPAKTNAYLYIHAASEEPTVGHDLTKMQWIQRSEHGILANEGLGIAAGVDDGDLEKIYQALDVFALTTLGEGWGLPVMEAMSCGLPVILPKHTAYTEWIDHGVNGYLVPTVAHAVDIGIHTRRGVCDPGLYIWFLDQLVSEPIRRAELGEAARKTALQFDWSKIIPQWKKLLLRYRTKRNKSWRQLIAV